MPAATKTTVRGRARSGFTLIELLIVVVIIGILASIAMPSFVNAQDNARNANAIAGLNVIRLAMESYGADNKASFPLNADFTTAAGLAPYLPGGKLPKSPWSKNPQAARIGGINYPGLCAEWLNDTTTYPRPVGVKHFSPQVAGQVAATPTMPTHYGAYVSDTEDSNRGGARDQYVVNAMGKRGGKVVVLGHVTNSPGD